MHLPAKIISWTILGALLSSCVTPTPISILNNKNEAESYWANGQEIISLKQNDVLIELGYDREIPGMLVFDVYVQNDGQRSLELNPRQFKMTELNAYMDTVAVRHAKHPQSEIYDLDKSISRNQAAQTNQAIGSAFLGAAEFVIGVTNELSEESEEEKDRVRTGLAYSRLNRAAEARELNFQEMSLQDKRAYWEAHALRRSTLFPGYYLSGKVHFPKTEHTGLMILSFPVGQEIFEFRFEHLLAPID